MWSPLGHAPPVEVRAARHAGGVRGGCEHAHMHARAGRSARACARRGKTKGACPRRAVAAPWKAASSAPLALPERTSGHSPSASSQQQPSPHGSHAHARSDRHLRLTSASAQSLVLPCPLPLAQLVLRPVQVMEYATDGRLVTRWVKPDPDRTVRSVRACPPHPGGGRLGPKCSAADRFGGPVGTCFASYPGP